MPAESPPSPRRLLKPLLFLLGLAALFLVSRSLGLDKRLGELQIWIRSFGGWGPAVFVGVYALATVCAIPGSALTLVAGALFGSVTGVITVSLGSTLGAALCFLIARYVARSALEKSLQNNPLFQKLEQLSLRQGALIVAITRLVPFFPFNLLNYGFGLTNVPFWTYLGMSWLCMLPGTVLYVVGADALSQALAQGQIPWHLVALVGLLVVGLAWVTQQAQKNLKDV